MHTHLHGCKAHCAVCWIQDIWLALSTGLGSSSPGARAAAKRQGRASSSRPAQTETGPRHWRCERHGAKGETGGAWGEAPAQKEGLPGPAQACAGWPRARRTHPQLAVAAPPARPVAPLQPVRLGLGANRGQLQRQREQQPRPLAARAAAPRPALARRRRLAAGVRARAALPPLRPAAAALLRPSPPLPQRITHAAAWRDCPCSTVGFGGPSMQYAVQCTADLSRARCGHACTAGPSHTHALRRLMQAGQVLSAWGTVKHCPPQALKQAVGYRAAPPRTATGGASGKPTGGGRAPEHAALGPSARRRAASCSCNGGTCRAGLL